MNTQPPLHAWLIEPLSPEVATAVDRLRRAPDVRHVALMPDVHLATDVCVGTVFGTSDLIYPQAVGGDIGCGMFAIAFDCPASRLADAALAGAILADLGKAIPSLRRHRDRLIPMPDDLTQRPLSDPQLTAFRDEAGVLQFGTLGSGNHFVELQADDDDTLWLMIHSGSRSMGQAIRDHHLARSERVGSNLRALSATHETGRAYLNDLAWARRYADANRRAMAACVESVMLRRLGAGSVADSVISIDHNHVELETHDAGAMWVHRKGATPAHTGRSGVVPGSMGTYSYRVTGRGCALSLRSSAHGAGRRLSREKARRGIAARAVEHQMRGVWYDYRLGDALREEAPSAYKDVRAVMRAQSDLIRIDRTLRPVLSFKGR
jgi:tRNA-splicing ligase RtcB (3'-phosphate/5'-hydroxy nucleic acid ligase)